jgi:hypothetical protein
LLHYPTQSEKPLPGEKGCGGFSFEARRHEQSGRCLALVPSAEFFNQLWERERSYVDYITIGRGQSGRRKSVAGGRFVMKAHRALIYVLRQPTTVASTSLPVLA